MTPEHTLALSPARARRPLSHRTAARTVLVLAAAALPMGSALPVHAAPAPSTVGAPVPTSPAAALPSLPVPSAPVAVSTAPIPTAPVVLPATPRVSYTVAVGVANVRKGPGMDQTVIGSLSRGSAVTGTVSNGWLRIADGRYVGTSVLTRAGGTAPAAPSPSAGSVTRWVSAQSANVRSGPGTGHRIVGSLARGTQVSGTVTDGWLQIGQGRYMSGVVLSSTAPGGSAPAPGAATVTRYVTASVGNVRSGPGLSHGVVGSVTRDTRLTGTLTGGWLKTREGRYVSGTILTSAPPRGATPPPSRDADPVTRYVTATAGNVRSAPSTSASVVGTLSRGTRVTGTLGGGWLALGGGRFVSGAILATTPPSSTPAPAPAPAPRSSVDGQAVLDMAQRYTGIMYRWGGTTPAGFDCSGYTQFVYAQLGVALPRTVAQQRAATTPVTDPQPGDLVFWGVGHVAIYAGDNQIYDSGRPGLPTQKRNMFSGVTGFGRVG